MKRLTQIRGGRPCIVLQQNATDTWMLTKGQWKGRQAQFLYGEHAKFLSDVQDILGDDYDLDRLRELVEADRDGRLVVLPDVDKRARESMANGLEDVFQELAYEDPTVGLFGMSDGEKELANALLSALKGDRHGKA